jgi:geranylgeranylglycerol-phosphate geranylgeranyltransferase
MSMGKPAAILKLTRVEHSLMLAVAVVAAELLAGGIPSPAAFLLSLIAPVFISMASFAVNDYFDIKVDRLNKKERPLVEGSLTPGDAIKVAVTCFAIGIAAALLLNIYALVIAVAFAALAVLYSYKLKEIFLLGNIYIAFTMVIPFIFGSYVVASSVPYGVLLICAMVFFSGLAREIHGTVRDYRGDVKVRKVKTLPRIIGMLASSILALLFYLVAIAMSAYLFLKVPPFKLNLAYGVVILVSDLMLLYVGAGYLYKKKHAQRFYDSTRNISLLAMVFALVAILIAALPIV